MLLLWVGQFYCKPLGQFSCNLTITQSLTITSDNISHFKNVLQENQIIDINRSIQGFINLLEEKSELVLSKIDDVSVLINRNDKKAKELQRLILLINIISLPVEKRKLFCEYYAKDVLIHIRNKGGNLVDSIEKQERNFKSGLSKIIDNPSIKGVFFLNSLISLTEKLNISQNSLLDFISNAFNGMNI